MPYLCKMFEDADLDLDDNVHYKQWIHTDSTTLVSLELSVNDYVDMVSGAVKSLTAHHFIAKSQSEYLRNLKEHLNPEIW